MMASVMEELEIKEPTPSLAPSLYESPLYTKKWRIVLAILLGVTLLGVCVLGFYVSVRSRSMEDGDGDGESGGGITTATPAPPFSVAWRSNPLCTALNDHTCPSNYPTRPLIVIGVAGLRPDLVSEELTPALTMLSKCGVTAPSLVPTYPTTTFPNMYTIATGLYAESHGIIGEKMYDPELNKTFEVFTNSALNPEWWGGEPIWNTVGRSGKRSAIVGWPGSNVYIQKSYPSHWQRYNASQTSEHRMKQVLEWIQLPEVERPHLMMVYLEQPMAAFEHSGIDSKQGRAALMEVDRMIDLLMSELVGMNLAGCVNVLVVSDHGASPTDCTSSFYLETFILNIEELVRVYIGAVGRLGALPGSTVTEEAILEQSRCKNSKIRVMPKKNYCLEGTIMQTVIALRVCWLTHVRTCEW